MKRNLIAVLWVCLALCLVLSFPGVKLRLSNESNNRPVITVADFRDFSRAADSARSDIGNVLDRLKNGGTSAVALKELTPGELAYRGDISITTASELLAVLQNFPDGRADRMRYFMRSSDIRPSAAVIIASKPDTAALLKERLDRRFDRSGLNILNLDGQNVFFLNLEKEEVYNLGLGFEESTLAAIKAKGFDILLRPKCSPGSNLAYLDEYEKLVKEYDARYVIFDGGDVPGYPDNLDVFSGIINKNNIILGIIEARSQVRYVPQNGLEKLFEDTGYAINRAYITPDDDLEKLDSQELYHRWIRCVADRNIRFIYVSPLLNKEYKPAQNIDAAVDAAAKLNSYIGSKGYDVGQPLKKLSDKMPGRLQEVPAALSLVFAGALFLLYFTAIARRKVLLLAAAGAAAAVVLSILSPVDLSWAYALGAAVLYPGFSGLLAVKYLQKNGSTSFAVRLMLSLVLVLGVNTVGIYTIFSSLSTIRYTMNVDIYRGVIISFVAPLIIFTAFFAHMFTGLKDLKAAVIRLVHRKITYFEVFIALAVLGVLFVYLARSGNNIGVPATTLEKEAREFLEGTLLARPRFKEFAVGYPSLCLMVYLYGRYKKPAILLVFGLGTVIGSVSLLNSFCHVFTSAEVSGMRSLFGLVFGLAVGAAAVAAVHFGKAGFDRYRDSYRKVKDKNGI